MSDQEARNVAAAIGRLTGREEISDAVLSGRMTAAEVVPLLAGLVDGVTRSLFIPMVGGNLEASFDPTETPTTSTIALLDGSRIRVTIEAQS